MKPFIQAVWKRAGKVEKAFTGALILYLVLLAVWPDSGFESVVAFVTFILGAWIAFRLLAARPAETHLESAQPAHGCLSFHRRTAILLVLTLVGLGLYLFCRSSLFLSGPIGI